MNRINWLAFLLKDNNMMSNSIQFNSIGSLCYFMLCCYANMNFSKTILGFMKSKYSYMKLTCKSLQFTILNYINSIENCQN